MVIILITLVSWTHCDEEFGLIVGTFFPTWWNRRETASRDGFNNWMVDMGAFGVDGRWKFEGEKGEAACPSAASLQVCPKFIPSCENRSKKVLLSRFLQSSCKSPTQPYRDPRSVESGEIARFKDMSL
jgi:hypothetical protein